VTQDAAVTQRATAAGCRGRAMRRSGVLASYRSRKDPLSMTEANCLRLLPPNGDGVARESAVRDGCKVAGHQCFNGGLAAPVGHAVMVITMVA